MDGLCGHSNSWVVVLISLSREYLFWPSNAQTSSTYPGNQQKDGKTDMFHKCSSYFLYVLSMFSEFLVICQTATLADLYIVYLYTIPLHKSKTTSFFCRGLACSRKPQPLSFQTSPGVRIHHELGRARNHPHNHHVAPMSWNLHNELGQTVGPNVATLIIYKSSPKKTTFSHWKISKKSRRNFDWCTMKNEKPVISDTVILKKHLRNSKNIATIGNHHTAMEKK